MNELYFLKQLKIITKENQCAEYFHGFLPFSPWQCVDGNNWDGDGTFLPAHYHWAIFYSIYSFRPADSHSNNIEAEFHN